MAYNFSSFEKKVGVRQANAYIGRGTKASNVILNYLIRHTICLELKTCLIIVYCLLIIDYLFKLQECVFLEVGKNGNRHHNDDENPVANPVNAEPEDVETVFRPTAECFGC